MTEVTLITEDTYSLVPITQDKTAVSPLLQNLVSWWSFEDDLTDSHGANNLTGSGTPTYLTGQINRGLQLISIEDDFVVHADPSPFSTSSDFTMAGWARITNTTVGNHCIASIWDAQQGISNREWSIVTNGSNLRFDLQDSLSATSERAEASGLPGLNIWFFFVAQYNSATKIGTIEFNRSTTENATALPNDLRTGTDEQLWLGKFANSITSSDIDLDELGFWGRLLTSDELDRLYSSGTGITYPG